MAQVELSRQTAALACCSMSSASCPPPSPPVLFARLPVHACVFVYTCTCVYRHSHMAQKASDLKQAPPLTSHLKHPLCPLRSEGMEK